MEVLAQHPLSEDLVHPHCGRAVVCVLANGDYVYGMLEKVADGHVYLKPLGEVPPAAVSQLKKSGAKRPAARSKDVATTSAWGFGYPYGYGYGGWVLPLFLLTALLAFPFFW